MTGIRLQNITKFFGDTPALSDISLQIAPGELFFLLGPSGCGKSTLLRLIAGLHEPTSGQIFFNTRDVTRLSTESRNAVMCFQSYALWPHMSVRQNVAFGLDVRKMSKPDQQNRVDQVLQLVQMADLAERKPNELSGGQQQRVALARAMAVQPDCLLLDEPLSNLDAKLRHEMRSEIRRICKSAGFTTIYVTHDQKEALSVADRIALLNAGKIEQVGTPAELYLQPRTSFAADFIGATNLLRGSITSQDGQTLQVSTDACVIVARRPTTNPPGNGAKVTLSIRPEQLRIQRGAASTMANRLTGKTIETTFQGETSDHIVQVGKQRLKIISLPPMPVPPPEMTVEFSADDVVMLAD